MSEPLLFVCTYGADEPERATVPLIAANTAVVSGKSAIVVCTAEAVRLGTPGYAQQVEVEAMPTMTDLLDQFLTAGGDLWLCSACTSKRGITGDDLIHGAQIVGAATIVEALSEGRAISLT